jgi:hypothetical protein
MYFIVLDGNDIIQVAIAVILLFTAAVYLFILRESRKATSAAMFKAAIDILQEENVRKARHTLINQLSNKILSTWTDSEIREAEIVCNTYDSIGAMVQHKLIPQKYVVKHWGFSLQKTWQAVQPLVKKYRAEREFEDQWHNYEWLATKSEKRAKLKSQDRKGLNLTKASTTGS